MQYLLDPCEFKHGPRSCEDPCVWVDCETLPSAQGKYLLEFIAGSPRTCATHSTSTNITETKWCHFAYPVAGVDGTVENWIAKVYNIHSGLSAYMSRAMPSCLIWSRCKVSRACTCRSRCERECCSRRTGVSMTQEETSLYPNNNSCYLQPSQGWCVTTIQFGNRV